MKIEVWTEYFKSWSPTDFKSLNAVIPYLTSCFMTVRNIKSSPTRLTFEMKYPQNRRWATMIYRAVTK